DRASVTGGVTPVYAAPETFDGYVSRFSDQYSLGIVYQELLTGQRPFSGTTVRQLIMQHLSSAPDLSALPPADQRIIGRSLSKTPDQRFPTCREMVAHLKRNSHHGTQTTGGGPASAAPPVATPLSANDSGSATVSAPTAALRGTPGS